MLYPQYCKERQSCQNDLVGFSQRVHPSCHPLPVLVYSILLIQLMTPSFCLCSPPFTSNVTRTFIISRKIIVYFRSLEFYQKPHMKRSLTTEKKALKLQKTQIRLWLLYPSTWVPTCQSKWSSPFFNHMAPATTMYPAL